MKTRHHELLEWLRTASNEQIAATGTTRAYLKQIAYGHKPASPEIAVRVEAVAGGTATRKSLRPYDWHVLWPELVDSHVSKPTPPANEATTA
ncbi:hypothetical protein NPJ88_003635 [Halomonas elongata]|uniref:hypothetical protein n=1 Tax=Halomonas elongata TaxID=2746 RepID=UPI00255A7CE0|nr:hypothetical protein [Halomonas elongata]MDL4861417.1 hypothetical protein [Halomonas elongata]